MNSLAFDTHRAVKALCEAGAALRAEIIERQAEVANIRSELKTDIGLIRAEFGDLEVRLYRQLWLMAAGIVGLTVALVKLLD